MNDEQPVALGERPPDLLVRGGEVYFPTLGEFQRCDVAVVGDRIAALVEPDDHPETLQNGADVAIVDATGKRVVPGFLDAHTHLDLHGTFERAYHYVLGGGTTTVISEVAGFGPAFGASGVREFLDATADLPVDVRATVPPQPLIDTFGPASADDATTEALCDLLAEDRVVGVGETDWIHVVGRTTPAETLYARARAEGKPIAGHGAGCSGAKLAAFASVVDDDHEAITGEGAVERLANGLHVIGRSGSIRDDAAAIADAYEQVGAADLSLSTDGMWPPDLIEVGYMDEVLRRVIAAGVPPEDAIRMATFNPARHFGLSDRGVLAPGKRADIVVLDDLESVAVETVVAGGTVVVEGGEPTVGPRPHRYPDEFTDCLHLSVEPDQFHVSPEVATDGVVRAIENRDGLVTAETTVEPPVVDGNLAPDPEAGVCKVALLDRDGDGGFTGFLTGLAPSAGAAATSISWESGGVVVVGANEADMVVAARHVDELGGGWAVVRDGEVIADFPAPVGGIASDLPVETTAARYETVEAALRTLGVDVEKPGLTIQTLTFPGVPVLKLVPTGYADVIHQTVVGLSPD